MEDSYIFESPVGTLKICEEDRHITRLCLLRQKPGAEMLKNKIYSDLLYEAYKQLNEYFLGKRTAFSLPIRYEGTEFQRLVWDELQKIPYGETRSYEEIAAAVGNKNACRAVGSANNKNPILIIVPCHRVIHKNGSIEGFACGTKAKRFLLDLEKNNADK